MKREHIFAYLSILILSLGTAFILDTLSGINDEPYTVITEPPPDLPNICPQADYTLVRALPRSINPIIIEPTPYPPEIQVTPRVMLTKISDRTLAQLVWGDGQVLRDGYENIRNLLQINQYLIFVGELPNAVQRLEWLNLYSLEHRILSEDFNDLRYLRFDGRFGWFTAMGYRYSTRSTFQMGYTLDGNFLYEYPNNYGLMPFFSPNQRFVAMKIHTGVAVERLDLIDLQEHTSITLAENLSGLGDPIWSRDSQLILHTQAINREPITYQITRQDGEILQQGDWIWGWDVVSWEACPS